MTANFCDQTIDSVILNNQINYVYNEKFSYMSKMIIEWMFIHFIYISHSTSYILSCL